MPNWPTEVVLAFMTLLVACVPLAAYLWRRFCRRGFRPPSVQGANIFQNVLLRSQYLPSLDVEIGGHDYTQRRVLARFDSITQTQTTIFSMF